MILDGWTCYITSNYLGLLLVRFTYRLKIILACKTCIVLNSISRWTVIIFLFLVERRKQYKRFAAFASNSLMQTHHHLTFTLVQTLSTSFFGIHSWEFSFIHSLTIYLPTYPTTKMQWLPLALLAVNAFIPSVYAIPGVRYLDQLGNLCQYFLFFSFFFNRIPCRNSANARANLRIISKTS